MSVPSPHLFSLILVEFSRPREATVGHQPAERRRFEVGEEHKAVVRFDPATGRLHAWITVRDDEDRPYPFQVQLAHARMTGFSEGEVIFEGVEVGEFLLTGRSARVIFTNTHSGWQ